MSCSATGKDTSASSSRTSRRSFAPRPQYLQMPSMRSCWSFSRSFLRRPNSKEAYDEIADEIFRLRELKQQTTVDTVTRDEQIKRITALQDFIRSQPAELTEFDEALVRRWFKRITVYEDHYTVELKSGLSVDIDAE